MEGKKYWKGINELQQTDAFVESAHNEFAEKLPVEEIFDESIVNKHSNRRDFLKRLGFSATAVTVAASCKLPVKKAIPYAIKPEEITPSIANYYASTYQNGGDYCSILVKTVEGRPIKIEGNELSPLTSGGTSSRVQASILDMYDTKRLTSPMKGGEESDWSTIDGEITSKLRGISDNGGTIALLTGTIMSPSTLKLIEEFGNAYPGTKHISYDAISYSGMIEGNEMTFGKRLIPSYDFSKANVIVSFGADFLGTWLSPITFTTQYMKNRRVNEENPSMSRHYQFEANFTITGGKADLRIPMKNSQTGVALLNLYNHIATMAGESKVGAPAFELAGSSLEKAASDLWAAKGESLVVCGSNDKNEQALVNSINQLLGNYGNAIDEKHHAMYRQGVDSEMAYLLKDMKAGNVDAILVHGVNPVYDYSGDFADAIGKTELSVSFNLTMDETSSACTYVATNNHFLESWNDAMPTVGHFSLAQPTIAPIFDSRSFMDTLLKWSGASGDEYDYVKAYWKESIAKYQNKDFSTFWDQSVHDGVFNPSMDAEQSMEHAADDSSSSESQDISSIASAVAANKPIDGMEVTFYETLGMGDGRFANNPWLQETPDPVSKVVWDNYASISPKMAEEMDLMTDPDIPETKLITINGFSQPLPVVVQPGIAYNTVSVALGFGRTAAGPAGDGVGVNVYPLVKLSKGNRKYYDNATVAVAEGTYEMAITQTHHNLWAEGLKERSDELVRETSLSEYKEDKAAGNELHKKYKDLLVTLYPREQHLEREEDGHHWGMAIDLNACTGCSACVVACHAENNVPVVGKTEMMRKHDMHWMRIDMYYSGDPESPSVTYMPLMCQHCDNAPCENVCPVGATNHSSEGLNQMAYNRCIGTRYCANNCPFKVRRFNWYDYGMTDSFPMNEYIPDKGYNVVPSAMKEDLTRMVLNPDVSVRSRGVMEKCTFCVQRLQAGKLTAKKEGRKLKDGDIKVACQQACPANAIYFGDVNDPESEISKKFGNERTYYLLEQVHVLPSVGYMTKITNTQA